MTRQIGLLEETSSLTSLQLSRNPNDIPQWTNAKPNNNSIIPLMTGSEYLTVTAEELSDWATDSNGWNLNCVFTENGWSSRQDETGNLLVSSPSGATSSTATCSVSDPFGAVAEETLDFTFGQPFIATAAINDGENIDFTVTPSGLVAEMTVSAHASPGEYHGLSEILNGK